MGYIIIVFLSLSVDEAAWQVTLLPADTATLLLGELILAPLIAVSGVQVYAIGLVMTLKVIGVLISPSYGVVTPDGLVAVVRSSMVRVSVMEPVLLGNR